MGMGRSWLAPPGREVNDRDVADTIAELAKLFKPKGIAYNSYTTESVVHTLRRVNLPLVDFKGFRYFGACAILADQVKTGGIVHDGDPFLAEHIGQAVREDAREAGYWFLSRKKSPGPICAAEAAAMLTHIASRPQRVRSAVVTLAG